MPAYVGGMRSTAPALEASDPRDFGVAQSPAAGTGVVLSRRFSANARGSDRPWGHVVLEMQARCVDFCAAWCAKTQTLGRHKYCLTSAPVRLNTAAGPTRGASPCPEDEPLSTNRTHRPRSVPAPSGCAISGASACRCGGTSTPVLIGVALAEIAETPSQASSEDQRFGY
jgi:hypothetical protein